jgi:hypothetical protein
MCRVLGCSPATGAVGSAPGSQEKSMNGPLDRARRKLCLEIAEAIGEEFGFADPRQDIDQVAAMVSMRLPLTYAEAQEHWDALDNGKPDKAAKPLRSVSDELRKALGLAENTSIIEAMAIAVHRIRGQK